MKNDNICLCGSTFFDILISVKKTDVSDYNCLYKLLSIVDPSCLTKIDEPRDLVSYSSKLKACSFGRAKSSKYLKLGKSTIYGSFKNKIDNEHNELVEKLDELFTECTPNSEFIKGIVVKTIMAVIACDSIADNKSFYIYNVGFMSKQELLEKYRNEPIPFYDFIAGIIYYVYANFTFVENEKCGQYAVKLWGDLSEIHLTIPNYADFKDLQIIYNANNMNSGGEAENSEDTNTNPDGSIPHKLEEEDIFKSYIEWLKSNYRTKKTLLYKQPEPFEDFYVCNNLKWWYSNKIEDEEARYDYIKDATIQKISNRNKFVFLEGTGGIGKSMMMQHLLLDAAENYKQYKRIPIFLELKQYSKEMDLEKWALSSINVTPNTIKDTDFKNMLSDGDVVFLFDGMDEIKHHLKEDFETNMSSFVDKYSNCQFIISTREYENLISFRRFWVCEVDGLTINQAVSLITKLRFRPDQPSIKESFIEDLKSQFWKTHPDFVQSPLLLTIMLMTYERYSKIPDKMHEFYWKAYFTLAEEHDATKGACVKRQMQTGLSADDFLEYLAEFSARTYKADLYGDYKHEDIKSIFESLNIVNKKKPSFTYKDFIHDMKANLCLFYEEGDIINWSHRSFQEYFCAYYLSKQLDRNLSLIGNHFFGFVRKNGSHDLTFGMLYDMIPAEIEEYLLLPYLEKLFESFNDTYPIDEDIFCSIFGVEQGYWNFLSKVYPEIWYPHREVTYVPDNTPCDFFYRFFVHKYGLIQDSCDLNLPYDEELSVQDFGYILVTDYSPEPDEHLELMAIDEIDSVYIDTYGEPEVEGSILGLKLDELFEDPDYYIEHINCMEQESFPLLVEYRLVKSKLTELREKIELKKQKTEETDIFELLS